MNPTTPKTSTPESKTSTPESKTSTPDSKTSTATIQLLPSSKKPVYVQSLFGSVSLKSSTTSSAFEFSPVKQEEGPSPAKLSRTSRNSLDDFSKNMSAFQEDLDTKLKAVLYLLMVGDVQSAREDLTRLRRISCAYFSQSAFVLKDFQMKAAATQHKLTTTENYNLHLHRQNNDLRGRIKSLKMEMASKDAQAVSQIFDDDFDGDDLAKNSSQGQVGKGRGEIESSVSEKKQEDSDCEIK